MALKHKATNHIFFKMAKKEKALLCDDEESNNTENEAQGFTKDSWRAFLVCFSLLLSYMHMYRATDLLIDSDVECHKIAWFYIALWFFLRLF